MARELNTTVHDQYSKDAASWWLRNIGSHDASRNELCPTSRAWLAYEFYKFAYLDAFKSLAEKVANNLDGRAGIDFEAMIAKLKKDSPRDEKVFHMMLADKLAIDPDGEHIPGKIGTVQVGGRGMGFHTVKVEPLWSIWRRKEKGIPKTPATRVLVDKVVRLCWPIYAGEAEERLADSGVADAFLPGVEPLPVGALNTRISNECAILGADAMVDNLDEGALGAVIQGWTTAQATDPDTAIGAQTKCFSLTCSATAFGAAGDATGSALKTANAITPDSSADATATLAWCRASSSSVADTALDDHIDGEANSPTGGDFNFNTLSIVAGATVSMTSWTVSMPES